MRNNRIARMRACAYVVGPEEGFSGALKDVARHLGFEAVQRYRDLPQAERQLLATPLVFFLFAATDDLRKIKPVTEAIRFSSNARLRFSPMIYFSDSASIETIRTCINLGFDDIITLPFTLKRLEERLDRQLDRPLVYYQTPTYFGPDRRGRLDPDEGQHFRGTDGEYRRFEITRGPGGVHVLKDEVHVMI